MATLKEIMLAEAMRGVLVLAQAEAQRLHKAMEEARLDEQLYLDLAGQRAERHTVAELAGKVAAATFAWSQASAQVTVAEALLTKLELVAPLIPNTHIVSSAEALSAFTADLERARQVRPITLAEAEEKDALNAQALKWFPPSDVAPVDLTTGVSLRMVNPDGTAQALAFTDVFPVTVDHSCDNCGSDLNDADEILCPRCKPANRGDAQ